MIPSLPVQFQEEYTCQSHYHKPAILSKVHLRAQADSEIDRRQDAVDAGIATEEDTTALSE